MKLLWPNGGFLFCFGFLVVVFYIVVFLICYFRILSAGKYQHILDWHQLVQRQCVYLLKKKKKRAKKSA